MAELADMLSDLLADPKTGEKLRAFFEERDRKATPPPEPPPPPPPEGGDAALSALSALMGGGGELSMPDPQMIMKLTRAMNAMSSTKNDSRTRLHYDLKPYISKERGRRIDEAADILRLLGVLDILREERKEGD